MPTEWFFTDARGDRIGPVTPEALADLVKARVVGPDTEVSRDGRSWRPASDVKGLIPKTLFEEPSDEPWYYRSLILVSTILRVVAWAPIVIAGVMFTIILLTRDDNPRHAEDVAMLIYTGVPAWIGMYISAALLALLVDIARQLRRLSSR